MQVFLTTKDANLVFQQWLLTRKNLTEQYYSIAAEIAQGKGITIMVSIDIFMDNTLTVEFEYMATFQDFETDVHVMASEFEKQLKSTLCKYHNQRLKFLASGEQNTVTATRIQSNQSKYLAISAN